MEELKFQSFTFDTIARRKFVDDQDTILEIIGKIQELKNEINFMNDSKEFQDAESLRSGNPHDASRPVSFPPHPIPEGMVSRSFGVPSRREAAKHLGHMVYRKTFCKSRCVIISSLSSRIESVEIIDRGATMEKWKTRTRSRSEMPIWTVSQRFRLSVEETILRIMGQTNNDCRFQIFISTNSKHQPHLLAGR